MDLLDLGAGWQEMLKTALYGDLQRTTFLCLFASLDSSLLILTSLLLTGDRSNAGKEFTE